MTFDTIYTLKLALCRHSAGDNRKEKELKNN